jgi:hypothetical protein
VNAWSFASGLGHRGFFAIVSKESQIDLSVAATTPVTIIGPGFPCGREAKNIFVKIGSLAEIFDFNGDMSDACHGFSSLSHSLTTFP